MRKFMNIFAAALIMLAAVSCEKNEVLPDNNSEGKVVTLKASINNGETKASLGNKSGETYPVLWSEGDEIAVAQFIDSDVRVYKFTLTAGEGTPNGTFTCDDAEGFDPSSEYTVALYPYTSQLDFFVVQTNQNYAEKSFDSDAILMMAFMEEGSLKFNNILGILKLTIKGASDETVSSIELTADKPISGNAKFFDTGEGPYIVTEGPDADYKNNIVLNCPDVAIATAKEFLITVPAGTYDFAVTINTNKGTYYKSTTNKSITESMILKMPELNTTDMAPAYIENGVYLGDGVALPAEKDSEGNPTKYLIWAPVNCGYDAQKNTSADKYDGGYNPCPNGWKVPSQNDVGTLNINNNAEILYSGGTPVGLKVFGDVSLPTENSKWIFLPADGQTSFSSQYWTSTMSSYPEYYFLDLYIYDGSEGWTYTLAHHYDESRIRQMYIRCVKR